MKNIQLMKMLIVNKMFRKAYFTVKTNRLRMYLKIPYYIINSIYMKWKIDNNKISPWEYYEMEKAMEKKDIEYIDTTCDAVKFTNTLMLLFSLSSYQQEENLIEEEFNKIKEKILLNFRDLEGTSFQFSLDMYNFINNLTFKKMKANPYACKEKISVILDEMTNKVNYEEESFS